ncbi:MAG: hypothetical protein M1816_000992 [Peltula sp. TS41687]|nr:MAG: hypothetical protein M1816_000992 [Peltula sp. TS41687]
MPRQIEDSPYSPRHHYYPSPYHHDDRWQVLPLPTPPPTPPPPQPPPPPPAQHHESRPVTIAVHGKSVKIPEKVHEEHLELRSKLKAVGERDDAPPVWAFYKLLDFLEYGQFVGPPPFRARKSTTGNQKEPRELVRTSQINRTCMKTSRFISSRREEVSCDDDPGSAVKMIWKNLKYRDPDLMEWLKAYLREPGNWAKLKDSRAFREVIRDGGRFLVSVM